MVIQSSFKDYYDFVAKKYGGGDPKIVYARGRLAPLGQNLVLPVNRPGIPSPERYNRFRPEDGAYYMFLVIASRIWLLERPRLPSDNPNDYRVQRPLSEEELKALPWFRHLHGDLKFGEENPYAVRLCRLIGVPVFAIQRIDWTDWRGEQAKVNINGICPVLSRVGMPELVSPEQMYQELSMFMGNRMKEPPDADPPVRLSNRERILKHGFDLVKSFRHRK